MATVVLLPVHITILFYATLVYLPFMVQLIAFSKDAFSGS